MSIDTNYESTFLISSIDISTFLKFFVYSLGRMDKIGGNIKKTTPVRIHTFLETLYCVEKCKGCKKDHEEFEFEFGKRRGTAP